MTFSDSYETVIFKDCLKMFESSSSTVSDGDKSGEDKIGGQTRNRPARQPSEQRAETPGHGQRESYR